MSAQRCRRASACSPARKAQRAAASPVAQTPPAKRGAERTASTSPSTPRGGSGPERQAPGAGAISPDLLEILRQTPSRPASCGRSLGSTSAGPTPRRPGSANRSPRSVDDESSSEWLAEPASAGKWGARQSRKIFVGGVPQEVDREKLSTIFGSFGIVERAWLQRHRRDLRRNHRGFGFVLFKDEGTVDALLGADFSRKFCLPMLDDVEVEVKRALDNNEETPESTKTGSAPVAVAPRTPMPAALSTPARQQPQQPQQSPGVAPCPLSWTTPVKQVAGVPGSWLATPDRGAAVGLQQCSPAPSPVQQVVLQQVLVPATPWVCAGQAVMVVNAAMPRVSGSVVEQMAPAAAMAQSPQPQMACMRALEEMLRQAADVLYED